MLLEEIRVNEAAARVEAAGLRSLLAANELGETGLERPYLYHAGVHYYLHIVTNLRIGDAYITVQVGSQYYPTKVKTQADLEAALRWVARWNIETF